MNRGSPDTPDGCMRSQHKPSQLVRWLFASYRVVSWSPWHRGICVGQASNPGPPDICAVFSGSDSDSTDDLCGDAHAEFLFEQLFSEQDALLDNDEDAEAIKQIFGKSAKVEKDEPTDKSDDGSDPEKSNTVFPLQQEIELKKADQGKSSES